jgi:hypothetical protein
MPRPYGGVVQAGNKTSVNTIFILRRRILASHQTATNRHLISEDTEIRQSAEGSCSFEAGLQLDSCEEGRSSAE